MKRTSIDFNDNWEFRHPEENSNDWISVDIPHCWNSQDLPEAGIEFKESLNDGSDKFAGYGTGQGGDYYRGVCCYRKQMKLPEVDENSQIYIRFEGVNQDTEVHLNGELIGTHLGGYTAFQFPLVGGLYDGHENLLEVRVSNANNPEVPPVGGDLGHFGGIYRAVSLVVVQKVSFSMDYYASAAVFWESEMSDVDSGTLRLRAHLDNKDTTAHSLCWTANLISQNGETVSSVSHHFQLPPKAKDVEAIQMPFSGIKRWSSKEPNRYTIENQLILMANEGLVDEVIIPCGFRSFAMNAETGFSLNDEKAFLRGVGRHQDYAGMGYAVPDSILVEDTKMIKEMGANAMRSHYPLCDAIYKTCDEVGLMVWAKLPVMDKMEESDIFLDNTKTMMMELISQMRNHPSIILWGYACEILGDADWFWERPIHPDKLKQHFEKAVFFTQSLQELIKEVDPSRLVCNDFHCDPNPQWYWETNLTDINDVNSWNVYHGWYHETLEEAKDWLIETRNKAVDTPYILAEFGAGVDPRLHAIEPCVFDMTPEYSTLFHSHYHELMKSLPWLAGSFIWTWSDFQRTSLGDCMEHLNNKGMLTNDRKAKDAFYLYQSLWSNKPVLKIGGFLNPYRVGVGNERNQLLDNIEIYSNQESIEVSHNDKTVGMFFPKNGFVTVPISFENGSNMVVVSSERLSDTLVFTATVYPHDLSQWNEEGTSLAINVGQERVTYFEPSNQRKWMADQVYQSKQFGALDGELFRSWPDRKAWNGIRDGVNTHICNTKEQSVYQSFRVGLQNYKIDVANGDYEVEIFYCEPFQERVRLQTDVPHGADENGERSFSVFANGKCVIEELNPVKEAGVCVALSQSFRVRCENDSGIQLHCKPIKGEPLVCGILIHS